MAGFFVTGTDTEVGKTFISQGLLRALSSHGLNTVGFKPIAAGCERTPEGLRNEDALALQAASSMPVAYEEVNPIALEPPIAPHVAAAELDIVITPEQVSEGYQHLLAKKPDALLVEGAGGWRLPLGNGRYLSEFAQAENLPVVLVVGMRLGCLNHAILTAEAIANDGLMLLGWVANTVDEQMPYFEQNLATLKAALPAPCLGVVPKLNAASEVEQHLDVSSLLV